MPSDPIKGRKRTACCYERKDVRTRRWHLDWQRSQVKQDTRNTKGRIGEECERESTLFSFDPAHFWNLRVASKVLTFSGLVGTVLYVLCEVYPVPNLSGHQQKTSRKAASMPSISCRICSISILISCTSSPSTSRASSWTQKQTASVHSEVWGIQARQSASFRRANPASRQPAEGP